LRAKVSVFIELHSKTQRLQALLREREANEARYRALFDDSPVPLWELNLAPVKNHLDFLRSTGVVDLRSHFAERPDSLTPMPALVRLLAVNRATLEMCGASNDVTLRGALGRLFAPDALKIFADQALALDAGNSTTEAEAVLHTLSDEIKHVSVRISVLPGHEQDWGRVVVSSTDIAELHMQRAELERSNRELQQFAYATSHDLRAPLRAIDAIAGWLDEDLRKLLSDEQRDQMRLLRGRVRRMDRLLSDLLDYARADGEEVAVETVELTALMAEVTELCAPPNGFVVETIQPAPTLETARIPLRRILLNLVGNAIKHHDQANGHVSVEVVASNDRFKFKVSDDGPGIPPRFHDRVFQMFQTLRPRDAVEGSGMGLALVKKLVENSGGAIWLESNGSRGTTCIFTWPKVWQGRRQSATPMPESVRV
jgi:signal transduction histidine kinase